MPLPESFVADGLKDAEGFLLFGVALSDMTRDELIAAAIGGWKQVESARESHRATIDIMRLAREARERCAA